MLLIKLSAHSIKKISVILLFRREIRKVTYSSYLRGFYMSSMVYLERSTLFATLLSYVLLGYNITPEKVSAEI